MTKRSIPHSLIPLVLLLVLVPGTLLAQASRPGPLGPVGAALSDMGLEKRLNEAHKRNTDSIGTLELSYRGSGDLWSSMKKTNPQGLFVTIEVNGDQVKKIAKSQKPKVQEAVPLGVFDVKARLSRPGKRLVTECYTELKVGYFQVIFLPYGGRDAYFSCEVLPRLLPDEVVAEWRKGFDADQTQAFSECATTNPRGSTGYWTCIEGAGITLPQG